MIAAEGILLLLGFGIDCFHMYQLDWVSDIELTVVVVIVPLAFQMLPTPFSFLSLFSQVT